MTYPHHPIVPDPPLRPLARGALIATAVVAIGVCLMFAGCQSAGEAWILGGLDSPAGTLVEPDAEMTPAALSDEAGLVEPGMETTLPPPPAGGEDPVSPIARVEALLGDHGALTEPRAGFRGETPEQVIRAWERLVASWRRSYTTGPDCWSPVSIVDGWGHWRSWLAACYDAPGAPDPGPYPHRDLVTHYTAVWGRVGACHMQTISGGVVEPASQSNELRQYVSQDGARLRADRRLLYQEVPVCRLAARWNLAIYECPASTGGMSCDWMSHACASTGLWAGAGCDSLCAEYRDQCLSPPAPDPAITVSGPVQTMAGTPVTYTASATDCDPSPRGWRWIVDREPNSVLSTGRVELVWETAGRHTVGARNQRCGDAEGNLSVTVDQPPPPPPPPPPAGPEPCDLSPITRQLDALAALFGGDHAGLLAELRRLTDALADRPPPVCNPAPCNCAPAPDCAPTLDCASCGSAPPPSPPPGEPPSPPPPSGESLDVVHRYPGYERWELPPGQYRASLTAERGPDASHWQANAQIVVLVVRADHRWELQYRVKPDHWVWITDNQAREIPQDKDSEGVTGVLLNAPQGLIVEVGIPPETERKIGPKWAHWGPGEGWRTSISITPASTSRGLTEAAGELPEKWQPVEGRGSSAFLSSLTEPSAPLRLFECRGTLREVEGSQGHRSPLLLLQDEVEGREVQP